MITRSDLRNATLAALNGLVMLAGLLCTFAAEERAPFDWAWCALLTITAVLFGLDAFRHARKIGREDI